MTQKFKSENGIVLLKGQEVTVVGGCGQRGYFRVQMTGGTTAHIPQHLTELPGSA